MRREVLVVCLLFLCVDGAVGGVARARHTGTVSHAAHHIQAAKRMLEDDTDKKEENNNDDENKPDDDVVGDDGDEEDKQKEKEGFKVVQKRNPFYTWTWVYMLLNIVTFVLIVWTCMVTSTVNKLDGNTIRHIVDPNKPNFWVYMFLTMLFAVAGAFCSAFLVNRMFAAINRGQSDGIHVKFICWQILIFVVNILIAAVCEEKFYSARFNMKYDSIPPISILSIGAGAFFMFKEVLASKLIQLKLMAYPILIHIFLWQLFSFLYWAFRKDYGLLDEDGNVTDGLQDYTDAMYFSAITQTTVGYGDVPNHTKRAKMLSSCHALMVFLLGISNAFNMIKGYEVEEKGEDEGLKTHAQAVLDNGNRLLKALSLIYPKGGELLTTVHPVLNKDEVVDQVESNADDMEEDGESKSADDLLNGDDKAEDNGGEDKNQDEKAL